MKDTIESKSLALRYSVIYLTGDSWKKLNNRALESNDESFGSNIKVFYEGRYSDDSAFRLGLSYLMANENTLEMKSFGIYAGIIGYSEKDKDYRLESSFYFTASPFLTEIELGTDNLTGHLLSGGIDISAVYYLSDNWNIHTNLGYNLYVLFGMSSKNNDKALEEDVRGVMHGIELGIGVSYKI